MPFDIVLGFSVGLSVMLFWLGRRYSRPDTHVDGQLERYLEEEPGALLQYGTVNALTRVSFFERVIVPLWRGLLGRAGSLAPQRNVDILARRLETAGRPYGLNVLNFLGMKFIAAALFAVSGFLLGAVLLRQALGAGALFGLAFGFIGFYAPNIWLSMRIRERKRNIIRALPDALDMIVVCAEAGQSFDQALKRVSAYWHNTLTEEFSRILAEIALGRARREALNGAAERIQLPELSSLTTAIVQAEQLGVSIGKVLRVQADMLRTTRRQRAEELARQAAIKLLFPLVFLIFPAMFAVLLGPAVPLILQTFGQ